MSQETVYLKLAQKSTVSCRQVFLKDIAKLHCENRAAEAKLRAVKVVSFPETGKPGGCLPRKDRVPNRYIGSVTELLGKMEAAVPGLSVNNVGETDFIVEYTGDTRPHPVLEGAKTAFVCAVAFCGAAFAVMTFHNDANVTDVFGKVYELVLGRPQSGPGILELSYSIGLGAGILLFFNHFASWRITADPTPIEVEMRLYEENLGQVLIRERERKEPETDVS